MSVRQDAISLTKDDLLSIENVLYEAKKDELVARQIASVNTNFPPYAAEIGYDWYDRKGSAIILAAGGSAKDIPFVGEHGGRETMNVYEIATGVRYTKSERLATQAKSALGKGPAVQLDTLRVSSARRFVAEKENELFFVGSSKHGIYGVLNKTGITKEAVADGVTGTGAAKKLWANKTPKEILKDLLTAKTNVEADGFFTAKVLALPPSAYNKLLQPYSDQSPMTILSWLQTQGMTFEKIIKTRSLSAANNGFSTVDAFLVLDNSPEIIELAVPEDIILGEPVYDIIGTSEQAVTERTAGAIIRHPSAIYVGTGI